jgi:hypothetical protein
MDSLVFWNILHQLGFDLMGLFYKALGGAYHWCRKRVSRWTPQRRKVSRSIN